jgi:acetyl esterase/lipase
LAGDSAGANIALALATGNPGRVAGLVLLSPHLEFDYERPAGSTDMNANVPAHATTDVDAVAARWLRSAYLGPEPVDDPLVAPAVTAGLPVLAQLPPTLVQVGSNERGLAPACRFARRGRQAGVDVTLDVWDGLWHTWHYHRDLPEADRALAEAAAFIAATNR